MKNLKLFFLATIIITSYTVTAQVSITTDGSDPDGSAMLEVKSNEKGFLPPRMTNAEIRAISDPTEGLMVYSNEKNKPFYYDGNEWRGFDGTSTIFELGDSYEGGKIAYIFESGDPGYVVGETHGLIVSSEYLSIGIKWTTSDYQSVTVPATQSSPEGATSLTDGLANSNAIVAQAGEGTTYAAGLARAYTSGGYTDWYLPSKDELNKLYINRVAIGGFTWYFYWSSTEYDSGWALGQNFANGAQVNCEKFSTSIVRAIRVF